MKALLRRFWKDQSGGVIQEAVLVSGISLAIVPSVQAIGAKLNGVFTKLLHAFP